MVTTGLDRWETPTQPIPFERLAELRAAATTDDEPTPPPAPSVWGDDEPTLPGFCPACGANPRFCTCRAPRPLPTPNGGDDR